MSASAAARVVGSGATAAEAGDAGHGPPHEEGAPTAQAHTLVIVQRLTFWVLLIAVGLMLTGLERFFFYYSTVLHYGFDGLVVGCSVLRLCNFRGLAHFLRSSAVIVPVFLAYYLWGLAVSPTPDTVTNRVISDILLGGLAILAITAVGDSRESVRRLANVAQLAALATLVVMLYELAHPVFLANLQLATNPNAFLYSSARPSGFWDSPNYTGVILVVTFLLSFWATSRPLRWLGRFAIVVALYLTGSREAIYAFLAILVIIAPLAFVNASGRNGKHRFMSTGVGLVLAVGLVLTAFAIVQSTPSGQQAISSSSFARLLDPSGAQLGGNSPTRLDVFRQWLDVALHSPWYGGGIFSFHGTGIDESFGAHDIYLALWGESGLVVAAGYVVVLLLGLYRAVRSNVHWFERMLLVLVVLELIWEGFVSHNIFDDEALLIALTLAFVLPSALSRGSSAAQARVQLKPAQAHIRVAGLGRSGADGRARVSSKVPTAGHHGLPRRGAVLTGRLTEGEPAREHFGA